MSITSRFKESQVGQFWLKYEKKIVLAVGMIFIAAVAFEAGYLHGQKNKQEPVMINKIANSDECSANVQANSVVANSNSSLGDSTTAQSDNPARIASQSDAGGQKCAFVASKNSNKYHLATCQWAQKIKPENKICFSSAEEAQKRGYQGAKCCIK